MALALVVLPAAELGFAIIRRWRAGTSLLAGDRDHPYDQLVRRGWTTTQAVAAYTAAAIALAALGVVASRVKTPIAIAMRERWCPDPHCCGMAVRIHVARSTIDG